MDDEPTLKGVWKSYVTHVKFWELFVNNFLAPIQEVRLSPNLVSHTLGHRGQSD